MSAGLAGGNSDTSPISQAYAFRCSGIENNSSSSTVKPFKKKNDSYYLDAYAGHQTALQTNKKIHILKNDFKKVYINLHINRFTKSSALDEIVGSDTLLASLFHNLIVFV